MSVKRSHALFLSLALALLAPAVQAGPATQLVLTVPGAATAGAPVSIIVEAKDSNGVPDPSYAGTISFSSTDSFASVPAPYTFTGADAGVKTFASGVVFRTAGSRTLTVFSDAVPPLTGISAAITVTGGAATSLTVSAPSTASSGVAFDLTVIAKDAYGNTSPGYAGFVQFTSTDGTATLPTATALAGGAQVVSVTLRANGGQTVTATDTITPSITGVSGTITVSATPVVTPLPVTLSFGGQSMKTTAPGQPVTISNSGGSAATITSVTASSSYGVAHDCGTVNPSASCTATVTFTPAVEGSIPGTLTIAGNAGTQVVSLSGAGEKSLVTHYYRSILRRVPDTQGKAFWDSEAARMTTLGANINEAWYAMAASFYASSEYTALNRTDAEFVADLYNTFFNRPTDASGLAYWTDQIAQGMPRGVVLNSFMFSNEFSTFAQGIFGNTAVRPENDTVTDFYRGLLARLPDDSGFNFWVQQFRTAQCQGATAVYAQIESISSQFAAGSEYAARNRTNAQYVADLYNAFLRRGGDLTGVIYWVGRLQDGTITREGLRQEFIKSAEFTARVNAIIAAGTAPGVTCAQPGVDTDINGQVIPDPTAPPGSRMCEGGAGSAKFPGAGPGPCGSFEIPRDACSTGMTGANAITKAWQYNLETYEAGSPRIGNNIWMALPRDHAMVFRFRTGPAGSMGPLPNPLDPNLLRYMTIGYEEHTGLERGPLAPRFVTLSETRCDFDYSKTIASGVLNGCYTAMTGGSSLLGKIWANGTPTQPVLNNDFPYCAMKPDTIYYLNIRYENATSVSSRGVISCNNATCGQAIGFN